MTTLELNILMARLVARITDAARDEMAAAPETPPNADSFLAAALVSASARFALDHAKLDDWAFAVGNYMESFSTQRVMMDKPQGRA